MIERLNVPNGYNCRIDPFTGRWITMGNVNCDVAELEKVGDQVVVKPGSFHTLGGLSVDGHQAYGGFWWKPDSLLWWHDEPGQRWRHLYDPRTHTEIRRRPANGTSYYARDGWFVEQDASQLWLSGGPVANTALIGPARLCEGWLMFPTDQSNAWLKLIAPDWRTHYFRQGSTNLHILGPGVATAGVGTFAGWNPPNILEVPCQVYPPSPQYPWGEVPDHLWRRPNGEIWLASHVLDPSGGDPLGQSYVILRPFFAAHLYRQFAVEPLDYLSLADLGGVIRLVGSYNANAWAMDVEV